MLPQEPILGRDSTSSIASRACLHDAHIWNAESPVELRAVLRGHHPPADACAYKAREDSSHPDYARQQNGSPMRAYVSEGFQL